MKISLKVSDLDTALSLAKHVAGRGTVAGAYSGVLIEASDGRVSVTGSDADNNIIGFAPSNVEEPGSVLLQPGALSEWLGTLRRGGRVTLATSEAGLETNAGGAAYRFRTMAMAFPTMARAQGTPVAVDLAGLDKALAGVRAASGTGGLVQLVSRGEELRVNATDTYRISQAVLPGGGWGEFTGQIPLAMLERVAEGRVGTVTVDQKGRVIEFEGVSARYCVRLSPIPFPAVEGLLASAPAYAVTLSLTELRVAIARLAALAGGNALRVRIAQSEMVLDVRSPLGEGSETLALEGEGEVVFGLNIGYIRDALVGRGGERIELGWTGPVAPLHLVSHEPLTVTGIVMPVRLSDD